MPMIIPPEQFSEADAERVVLDAVEERTGAIVSLSDPVSERFETVAQVRKLLGTIQDLILARHEIYVELADRPAGELEELQQGTYLDLALWVHGQVVDTGRPSLLIEGSRR